MDQQFGSDATASAVFADMIAEVHDVNEKNGWFDDADRPVSADIALLHSEVSEMLEAYRDWGTLDATLPSPDPTIPPKPLGFGAEAADVLIRLLDTAYRHEIDLIAEYRRKITFNRTRGYRHGGKSV